MVEKCHIYGVKNVFISGLVYTTRIGLPVLERPHEMIVHLCNKLGVCYVDNRNVKRKHLWKDGLHLVESCKVILANNFYLTYVNVFNTHTPSGVIYLDDDIRNTKLGISISRSSAADLEMLQNDRLKFLHNPLITYLNINSLKNKVIDFGEILKDLPPDYLVISKTKFPI